MSYSVDYKNGQRFLDTLTPALERQIVKAYKDALKNTQAKMAEYYAKYPMKYAEMVKYKRLEKLEKELTEIIRLFGRKLKRTANKGAERIYTTAYSINGFALENNYRFTAILPPQRAIVEAINMPVTGLDLDESLEASRKYLEQQVESTVTRGLIRGDSYTDMIRDLRKTFESNMNRNVMGAVRTQMHKVASIAQVDSFEYAESKGVQGRKYWVASLDLKTRPDHREMDGKPADDDGLFTFPDGVTRAEAPGLSGEPEQDWNCRCSVEYRFDEEPPEIRRSKADGIIKYKTYQEWFEEKYGEKP